MRRLIMLGAAVMLAACVRTTSTSSPGTAGEVTQTYATLRVDNQAFSDMTIYLVEQSGARSRLGMATGNRVTTLRIPDRYLGGVRTLRFQADPIGGNASPVSHEVTVAPGDIVEMIIPPR